MDPTTVVPASMKHLIVKFLVLLESHPSAPVALAVIHTQLVDLEISTRKHRQKLQRLRNMCPKTLSIAVLLLMTLRTNVNMNVPMDLTIVLPALRALSTPHALVVLHRLCHQLVSMTHFTVERIMPMRMKSAWFRVLVVIRTNVLRANLVFHSQVVTSKS